MKAIVAASLFLAVILSIAPAAFCDSQEARPVLTPGSDAQFDKRLPPVLPGEEVSDGKETMKVWSSSGPVPVGDAPEPWKNDFSRHHGGGQGVGVIVDKRGDQLK